MSCHAAFSFFSQTPVFSENPGFFLVGREDERCCLISSTGIIAFFLNPLGSQFAASEV